MASSAAGNQYTTATAKIIDGGVPTTTPMTASSSPAPAALKVATRVPSCSTSNTTSAALRNPRYGDDVAASTRTPFNGRATSHLATPRITLSPAV